MAATIGAFLLSILSTGFVESSLPQRLSIVGAFVGLERVENAGIAFGIDLPPALLVTLVPSALVLVAFCAWQSRHNRSNAVAFGLILGGALANIVDRFDDGFVTDFIQVGWWPVFNIADSCVTAGVAVLLASELRSRYTGCPNARHPLPR